jgi:DNA-binding CsgD family transcriptional regulator
VPARPPYLVLPGPGDLDRAAADLTRRGWRVHRGFAPADEPWDLAPARVVAVGVVTDRTEAEAALLCAVRGAGLVVTLDRDRSWAAGFLADLARLAPPAPGSDARGAEPNGPPPSPRPPAGSADPTSRPAPPQPRTAAGVPTGGPPAGPTAAPLTVEQCELLDLLAAGHSIAEAARMRYLSLRTANRRVADARTALGVPTTREAVLAYVRLRDLP